MQIAQIHESETDVRWQYPDDVRACKNCQKVLKSNKDKVGVISKDKLEKKLSIVSSKVVNFVYIKSNEIS